MLKDINEVETGKPIWHCKEKVLDRDVLAWALLPTPYDPTILQAKVQIFPGSHYISYAGSQAALHVTFLLCFHGLLDLM